MSQLSNLRETRDWLRAWMNYYGDTPKFREMVWKTATEQRANMESATAHGHQPHWCTRKEYQKCVELLEEYGREA